MKWRLLLLIVLLALWGCIGSISPSPSATPYVDDRPDGAIRLTTPPAGASDQNPAFSPDGSSLVFTRFEEGYNDGPAGLFLLDLNSGQISRLTPAEDQDNVNLPGAAWNAASDTIVFASDRSEADDLWRIAPDGSDLDRISTHTGLPWYIEPSWSPDGQWVVFEASRPGDSADGRVGEIWKIRSDGIDLTQLTSGFDDRQPNWSPAGDHILFQRRVLPDGQWDIFAIAPDGSDLQNLTDSPNIDETDASWSPGGSCIVYSTDNGGLPVPSIFIIDGGQQTQVTFSNSREDSAPSWLPDGKWIAFESHEGDAPAALWRIAVPEDTCKDR